MKLASVIRAVLTPERKEYLEKVLAENPSTDENSTYLAQLKSKDYKPGHSDSTWSLNVNDDEDVRDGL